MENKEFFDIRDFVEISAIICYRSSLIKRNHLSSTARLPGDNCYRIRLISSKDLSASRVTEQLKGQD